MADILRHAGHHVRCCGSAMEALRSLEQWPADVILTDLQMPGMNGLDFIRALGERNVEAQTVMVTAHATVSAAVDAMRLGAFDFIEKPFDVDQLEQLVARAMQRSQSEQQRSAGTRGARRRPDRDDRNQCRRCRRCASTSPASAPPTRRS